MIKYKSLLITCIIVSLTLLFSGCTSKGAIGAVNPIKNEEGTNDSVGQNSGGITETQTTSAINPSLITKSGSSSILRQPYLQAATTDSIYVLVETNSSLPPQVQYGVASSKEKTTTPQADKVYRTTANTYMHHIKLVGLSANTLYHYKVVGVTNPSSEYTFNTAKQPGTSIHYAVMTDSQSDKFGSSIAKIAGYIYDKKPDFVLHLGDTAQKTYYTDWLKTFNTPEMLKLMSSIPLYATPGNHDFGENTKIFTQVVDNGRSDNNYSFDYGDTHFVMVNNSHDYDSSEKPKFQSSGEVYNWVNDDLKNTNQTWKIFASHIGAYVSGGEHGEDPTMKPIVKTILEPQGVSLYLSGHSHFYQENIVNGIYHITTPAAGATPYDIPSASIRNYTEKSIRERGYLIIDETPKTMNITVYNEDNEEMDNITLIK